MRGLILVSTALLCAGAQASEIDTERPTRSDSPLTVSKGISQFEFEVAAFTHSRTRADQISIGAFEARHGLSEHTELQVLFAPYVQEREGGGKSPSTVSGIGDTTLRFKLSVLGNDPDANSIALLPFVKVPTAVNGTGKVEGGLLIPMQISLAKNTWLGFEVGAGVKRNEANSDNAFQFTSAYVLTQKFGEKLQAYIEIYSESEPYAEWNATVDTGAAYTIDDNNQIDAGINVGITPSADPYNPFVGYSFRF